MPWHVTTYLYQVCIDSFSMHLFSYIHSLICRRWAGLLQGTSHIVLPMEPIDGTNSPSTVVHRWMAQDWACHWQRHAQMSSWIEGHRGGQWIRRGWGLGWYVYNRVTSNVLRVLKQGATPRVTSTLVPSGDPLPTPRVLRGKPPTLCQGWGQGRVRAGVQAWKPQGNPCYSLHPPQATCWSWRNGCRKHRGGRRRQNVRGTMTREGGLSKGAIGDSLEHHSHLLSLGSLTHHFVDLALSWAGGNTTPGWEFLDFFILHDHKACLKIK